MEVKSATAAAEYFSNLVCDKKLCSCARDMVGVNVVCARKVGGKVVCEKLCVTYCVEYGENGVVEKMVWKDCVAMML